MSPPFLRSLRVQLILLIVGALVVAQAVSLWLFVDERTLAIRATLGFETAGRAANVARLIEEAPPGLHASILRAADSPLVRFSLDATPGVTHENHDDNGRIERFIRGLLAGDGAGRREIRVELHEIEGGILPLAHLSPAMAEMHRAMMHDNLRATVMNLSIRLADGRWLNVGTRLQRPPMQWPVLSVLTFGTTAALVLMVALWFVITRLTGPLRRLARSADRFGRGEDVAPLPETGPDEVRELTRAFNRMQERLRRFVADRTRILAAMSHDLRSPLTALRVRAEMVEDDETREALIESVGEMQRMAEATLDFAQGISGAETPETVRLADLVADTGAEAGGPVRVEGGPDLALRVRPVAFRRALRNLIGNAVRYGREAVVSWRRTGGGIVIDIRDRGPGIPEAERERVFDPFYRLETSRSLETGGHGLGLSIARSIVRAHGGEITLCDHPEGGLVARVTLPLGESRHAAGREVAGTGGGDGRLERRRRVPSRRKAASDPGG